MIAWWRRWRRKRLWQSTPFPLAWRSYLDELPFVAELGPEKRDRLERFIQAFIDEKHFIGASGFEVDDRARVYISAAACRLVLNLELGLYDRLTEIVIYPSHYVHPDSDGVVFGEAHAWGTVVLSWDAVEQGMENPSDGRDTAIHEFAHVLDREDGAFDGTPSLHASEHYRPWANVMSAHFHALRDRKRKARRALRAYGATNEAEFFAVATEVFFERPAQLQKLLPELYEELERYYGESN